MKYIILGCMAAALLAGCNSRQDRFAFDGKYFRANVSKVHCSRTLSL